ncbi:hypothetical protein CH366_06735 [Leptospira harrisiae]|uniref:Uncharacterized protein n=1 Tax=Leptospira harrisiae TaxID=2023189 RepID=A0A2N0ANE1_9LEPT|nr:hypothetical protein CH364_06450 [Leptospira harrisiae]PKA09392.1 hypothetical protein CH366_06735 [Leptospira harrisiae]
MNKLTVVYFACFLLFFAYCSKQKKEDQSQERRSESFLNCYLVKMQEFTGKTDTVIFQECLICYAKICNFPHLL